MAELQLGGKTIATQAGTAEPVIESNVTGTLGSGVDISNVTGALSSGIDMSAITLAANHAGVKAALNATGAADILACRAWADLNTQNADARKILNHHNVASCTENSTGSYSITFENDMPHANYTVEITAQRITASWGTVHYSGKSVSGFTIMTRYNGGYYEWPCNFAVFC